MRSRSSNDNPLKAKLLSISAVENKGFFTVGSTKDEVLAVQGMPFSFSDTLFTYPYGSQVLRDVPRTRGGEIPLGAGLLTTLKVMGTALINSHRYAEILPRGCRLAVDPALLVGSLAGVVISDFGGPLIVDWIHTRTAAMEIIIQKAGLNLPPSSVLNWKSGL